MKHINYADIDFTKLYKLDRQGTKSTTYTDGKNCYKIFNNMDFYELYDLEQKFKSIKKLRVSNLILPKNFITVDDQVIGYTMKYFKNSQSIYDKYLFEEKINIKEFFHLMIKCGSILRNMHRNGIICGDLNFDNILFNKKGEIMFCDIDSCEYGDYASPYVSKFLNNLIVEYRSKDLEVSENTDRITMLLSIFNVLYNEELRNFDKRQYIIYEDDSDNIKSIKEYVNILFDRRRKIPYIPYLDEILDGSEDYIFDVEEENRLLKRK